ncbi:MAG: hypothetical protein D6765_03940 [Bacteroidetes bacterium]|nr:MAG: hypothetical protein D6765_03940 [Bacteroidota bacterium]
MHLIRIVGVNGHRKTDLLRQNVLRALEALQLHIPLVEVFEVDKMMQLGISGIPALTIDEEVVAQRRVPSVQELKVLFENKLLPQSMDDAPKKYLIVPTDFSAASYAAFQTALSLAPLLKAGIKVVHVYSGTEAAPTGWSLRGEYKVQDAYQEKLAEFIGGEPGSRAQGGTLQTTVNIEWEAAPGLVDEVLLELSHEPWVEMIVMGTTGSHGVAGKLFGTLSSTVSRLAHCPVLLVPKNYSFRPFARILYASDFDSADEATLQRLKSFAGLFFATVHFVHVLDDPNANYDALEERIFNALFEGKEPDFAFFMTAIPGASVGEKIHEYAHQHDIDLIVVVAPRRDFWSQLLHRSRSKEMILKTRLPILVMHPTDPTPRG